MSDFPIDWNEWDSAFKHWRTEHPEMVRTPSPFPKKNMLASDVLYPLSDFEQRQLPACV